MHLREMGHWRIVYTRLVLEIGAEELDYFDLSLSEAFFSLNDKLLDLFSTKEYDIVEFRIKSDISLSLELRVDVPFTVNYLLAQSEIRDIILTELEETYKKVIRNNYFKKYDC